MKKNIEITTLQVSIRVLMLDGKRFAKAVFLQLPESFLCDQDGNTLGAIIGFVSLPDCPFRWVLLKRGGILYKCLGKKYDIFTNGHKFLKRSYLISGVDKYNEDERLLKLDRQAFDFVQNMPEKMQIFISI